jgi:hypothetical protein
MKPKHILVAFRQSGWYLRFPGQDSYYVLGRKVPERCVELSRYDNASGRWTYRWITGVSDDAINEYKRIYPGNA